jgi:hypothetical protein
MDSREGRQWSRKGRAERASVGEQNEAAVGLLCEKEREKGASLAVRVDAAGWRVEVGEPGGTRRRWEHQAAQGGGRVLPEAVPRSVSDGEGGPMPVYLEVLWEELLCRLISEGKSRRVGRGAGGAGCRGKLPGVRSLPPVQDKVVSGAARGED